MSERELQRIGAWVIETCLMFGASLDTAYMVAGHFIAGLRHAWADATGSRE